MGFTTLKELGRMTVPKTSVKYHVFAMWTEICGLLALIDADIFMALM